MIAEISDSKKRKPRKPKPTLDKICRPVPHEQGRYFVKSKRIKELEYLVDLDEFNDGEFKDGWCGCDMLRFSQNKMLPPYPPCSHIKIAKIYRQLQQLVEIRR